MEFEGRRWLTDKRSLLCCFQGNGGGYAEGWETASYPAKLTDLGGITMMTERYEDGMRIISVDTEDEFVEALDQMTNYRVAIEAPEEIREAFGIQSAEELGIEPDDLGLPAEAYERGRWN